MMWHRWTAEYLRALRECHCLKHGNNSPLAVGDVVIVKSPERNRNSWPLGIVERLIFGRDGVVRGARLRTGRSYIERRPVQHLYPLELSCDREGDQGTATVLNPQAPEFRPRRDTAVAAELRVQGITQQEQQG